MTKRYEVVQRPMAIFQWQVADASKDLSHPGNHVAGFHSRAHADRFADDLNHAEWVKEQSRLETMSVMVGGKVHTRTWMPGQANEQELTDWANGLLSGTGATVRVEQHKDAIPPPADTKRIGSTEFSYFSPVTGGEWHVASWSEPEKPQHPAEGEVCCRTHAPIVWAMNGEVWSKLPERCGR
jgi:hypothetical protein